MGLKRELRIIDVELRIIRGRRGVAAVGGCVLFAITKIDVICYDFGRPALVPFLVSPWADLQPTGDNSHAPLGEILADEFRRMTPSNDVDEIRFLLATLRLEVTLDRKAEACNGNSAASAP